MCPARQDGVRCAVTISVAPVSRSPFVVELVGAPFVNRLTGRFILRAGSRFEGLRPSLPRRQSSKASRDSNGEEKAELDTAVDRDAKFIRAQLDTLPVAVAKTKLKELHEPHAVAACRPFRG